MGACYEHFSVMYQWGDFRCHHVQLNWNLLQFCPMWQVLPQASEPGPSCSQKSLILKSLEGMNCQQRMFAYWIFFSFSWCDSWGSPEKGQELDFGDLCGSLPPSDILSLWKFFLRSEKGLKASGKLSMYMNSVPKEQYLCNGLFFYYLLH